MHCMGIWEEMNNYYKYKANLVIPSEMKFFLPSYQTGEVSIVSNRQSRKKKELVMGKGLVIVISAKVMT